MKTLSSFIKASNIPATLIRGVVFGLGGWDQFKESALDVANHGASGGYGSFCYYSDTVKFTTKHRKTIVDFLGDYVKDFDVSVVDMVRGFNCLSDLYDYDEVAKALYGRATEDSKTQIYNALAWFALEEVCRSYVDFKEEL